MDLTSEPGKAPGERSASGATTRMECGVCWHVYDPAIGDPVWQIAPGTAFAALPPHWTCPQCCAERHKFMVLRDG